MKRFVLTLVILAASTVQPVAQTQTTSRNVDRTTSTSPIRTVLDTYCIGCHSATAKAGGVVFAGIPLDDIGSNAEIWEKRSEERRVGKECRCRWSEEQDRASE